MASQAPIPFSLGAAARAAGTYDTTAIHYLGGYSNFYFEMAAPNAADFQNSSLVITAELLRNGAVYATATFKGDPSFTSSPLWSDQWDISQVQVGDTLAARFVLPVAATVGIANGLVF